MLEFLDKTVLNRKYLIYVFIIGNVVRGYIYHFFPLIDVIYQYLFVIWPVIIILSDVLRKRLVNTKYQILLWIFLVIAVISTVLNALNFNFSIIESLIYYTMHAYIFFTASYFYSKEEIQTMLIRIAELSFFVISFVALCSCVFYVLYKAGIVLPMGLNSHDRLFTYGHYGNEDRFCGLFGYSTNGGNYCMTAAVLGLFLASQKKIPTWLSWTGFLLHFITIYLMDVRTDILILIVVLIILGYQFLEQKLNKRKAIRILLISFIVVIISFVLLKYDSVNELIRRIAEDPYQASIDFSTGRTRFWFLILQHLPEKPLLGWGWLNSDIIGYFDAHNLFFNLLMWTGISGCGIFTVFLIMTCLGIHKNKQEIISMNNRILIILIICAFLDSMLDRGIVGTYYNITTSFFWLCTGFFVYLSSRKESRE